MYIKLNIIKKKLLQQARAAIAMSNNDNPEKVFNIYNDIENENDIYSVYYSVSFTLYSVI
jgi:transcriptional/translational regulatory protein YebC/TACO1